MASARPAISFIGLGAMGFGMATHLVKQGYSVRGFDVDAQTLQRFVDAGGEAATSIAACVAERPMCIVMVATAAQAQMVLLGGTEPAVPALPQGASLLLCSTVPAAYVRELEGELAQRGRPDLQLVDCPVSGGAGRAAEGTLSVMAGGSDAALAAGMEVLQAMAAAERLYVVDGGIGAGSNMKMSHQVLAACQILGAGEAMGLAARLGLDGDKAAAAVLASEGWSWMLENRAPRLLHPRFQPVASALAIIAKDAAIVTAEARRIAFPVSLAAAAHQAYLAGIARGWAADDDAAITRLYLPLDRPSIAGGADGPHAEDPARVALVVKLAKAVNTVAAVEALALARAVNISLPQLHTLAVDAAGGSWALRSGVGPDVLTWLKTDSLSSTASGGGSMGELIGDLRLVLDEAHKVGCPLYLASAAYGIATSVLRGEQPKEQSLGLLLRHYTNLQT